MDKAILITGASSGIGAGIARELAAAGAKLFLGARRTDRLEVLQGELLPLNANIRTRRLDVTDRADVRAFAEEARRLGPGRRDRQQCRRDAAVAAVGHEGR